MKRIILAVGLLAVLNAAAYATPFNCPDPNAGPLSWGEVPEPWIKNPLSDHNSISCHNPKVKQILNLCVPISWL